MGWLVLSQPDIVRTAREEGISTEKKKSLLGKNAGKPVGHFLTGLM